MADPRLQYARNIPLLLADCKRYTPEEDAELIAMKSTALSEATIAERLQRTASSVRSRIWHLRDVGRLPRPERKKSSGVASGARKAKLEDEEKASGR